MPTFNSDGRAMMGGTIFITGCDSRYFPLMQGCLRSLAAQTSSAIGVLDCGLSDEDIRWCRSIGCQIVVPRFDVSFGPGLSASPSFRAMTARPHLPTYFPGYDTYVWLDADVWVQDAVALDLLVESAGRGDIALIPELHRSYANLHGGRSDFEEANGRAYALAFGEDTAHRLIRRPLLNAGVFAMRRNSPGWKLWAIKLAQAARQSASMIDQIALNAAIYDEGLDEIRLPATCNWIAHLATPAWHVVRRCFVEPDPPYETIGILHLTLGTKWEDALRVPLVGPGTTRGDTTTMCLRSPPTDVTAITPPPPSAGLRRAGAAARARRPIRCSPGSLRPS